MTFGTSLRVSELTVRVMDSRLSLFNSPVGQMSGSTRSSTSAEYWLFLRLGLPLCLALLLAQLSDRLWIYVR
jgi:hypothetical protein